MDDLSLEQCYELLHLLPGASLDEIEAAYMRQAFQRLSHGEKSEKVLLKAAYDQLKQHLLQQTMASEAEPATMQDFPDQVADVLNQRLRSHQLQVQVRCQGEELRVLCTAAQGVPSQRVVAEVQQSLESLKLTEIHLVKVYGMRGRAIVWQREFALASLQWTRDDSDLYSFNSRITTVFAFPVAMVLAFLINAIFVLKILLLPFRVWIHEFGHATVAWLAGRQATPLPFGWTNTGEERSLFVYFGVLFLLGLLAWTGWQKQQRWAIVAGISLAIMQFYMTWLMSAERYEEWMVFGGIGGEFYLSTLLMVGFYVPLSKRWRWDFWRYSALVIAASTFWESFWLWHRIQRGQEDIPWESMFGEALRGDMTRLSEDFGWSALHIIHTYTRISQVCLVILIGVYLVGLLKHQRHWLWALHRRLFLRNLPRN